jgi:hypothetical protein
MRTSTKSNNSAAPCGICSIPKTGTAATHTRRGPYSHGVPALAGETHEFHRVTSPKRFAFRTLSRLKPGLHARFHSRRRVQHSKFGFRICFEFRISSFEFPPHLIAARHSPVLTSRVTALTLAGSPV